MSTPQKSDILQVWQVYLTVLRQWVGFFAKHQFYKNRNRAFFRNASAALKQAEEDFPAVLELSEEAARALYPSLREQTRAMSGFIQMYPPPEEDETKEQPSWQF